MDFYTIGKFQATRHKYLVTDTQSRVISSRYTVVGTTQHVHTSRYTVVGTTQQVHSSRYNVAGTHYQVQRSKGQNISTKTKISCPKKKIKAHNTENHERRKEKQTSKTSTKTQIPGPRYQVPKTHTEAGGKVQIPRKYQGSGTEKERREQNTGIETIGVVDLLSDLIFFLMKKSEINCTQVLQLIIFHLNTSWVKKMYHQDERNQQHFK